MDKSKRCKYSKFGIEALTLHKTDRTGIITGETRDKKCWIVKWDGNKSSSNFHKDFIELIPIKNDGQ